MKWIFQKLFMDDKDYIVMRDVNEIAKIYSDHKHIK